MPDAPLQSPCSWPQRALLALPSLVAVFATCCVLHVSTADAQEFALKADETQRWYRGNMHTHSLWSDGDDYPEMIAKWYQDHGYQFLVFTDHNTLHNRERWIDIERNKGGLKAFERLRETFSGDWIQTREEKGRQEVRLKEFDTVYKQFSRPEEFILIQGEEITDSFQRHPIHMCATNTLEFLPPMGGESVVDVMQKNIEAVKSRCERTGAKTLVHMNHPNFGYAITAEQLMQVHGEQFFEVYNGHSGVNNRGDNIHASTERQWDIINTWRLSKLGMPVMYGLATDDGHDYFLTVPQKGAQPGRGWVVILADKLNPDSLVTALEAGRFYSSSGVTLDSIERTTNALTVRVAADPEVSYRIDFIGTRKNFNDSSTSASLDPKLTHDLTRKYSDDVGKTLHSVEGTEASYAFDGTELYVRAVVTSSRLHPNPSQVGEFECAWVQPVLVASPQ